MISMAYTLLCIFRVDLRFLWHGVMQLAILLCLPEGCMHMHDAVPALDDSVMILFTLCLPSDHPLSLKVGESLVSWEMCGAKRSFDFWGCSAEQQPKVLGGPNMCAILFHLGGGRPNENGPADWRRNQTPLPKFLDVSYKKKSPLCVCMCCVVCIFLYIFFSADSKKT